MLGVIQHVIDTIESSKWVVGVTGGSFAAVTDMMSERGIDVVACDVEGPIPDNVDIVLTSSHDVVALCVLGGKQSILLTSLETMSTMAFHKALGDTKFDMIWPMGRSVMICDGERKYVGAMAWLIFHPAASRIINFKPLGEADDIELGSQDTEGGRDYDSDEEEERIRDQAILDDPNTQFTAQGYVQDGFVLDDLLENGEEETEKLGN